MTMATTRRYDKNRLSTVGDRAVVLGGSLAGLCAARVLADAFERVTVIERDPLPEDAKPRRGVPQANHLHVLLEAGRSTLLDLFPAFGEQLLSAGGLHIEATQDMTFYAQGGYLAGGNTRNPAYSATRHLIESVIRDRISVVDGVRVRDECQFTRYRTDETGGAVTGVDIRPVEAAEESLDADLIVDATGRTSRTPEWLTDNGFPSPPVDEVQVDVAYSTALIERPPSDRRGFMIFPSSDQPRTGAVVPVEGDRWLMTLVGFHEASPPTDSEGFSEYAASLPIPELATLLDEHRFASEEITHYPFPTSRRRYYEDLSAFPENLVVIGDAIASFNPVYGQGMSVGALESVHLHHALASGGLDNIGLRFFDRASEIVGDGWTLSVGNDHQFAETTGPKPRGTDVVNWYMNRLIKRSQTDRAVFDEFMKVQGMERPPKTLFRPPIVLRVLKPRLQLVSG